MNNNSFVINFDVPFASKVSPYWESSCDLLWVITGISKLRWHVSARVASKEPLVVYPPTCKNVTHWTERRCSTLNVSLRHGAFLSRIFAGPRSFEVILSLSRSGLADWLFLSRYYFTSCAVVRFSRMCCVHVECCFLVRKPDLPSSMGSSGH